MKLLMAFILMAQVNSVPPDVLQQFRSNVEMEEEEMEKQLKQDKQEGQEEYIKSHRYDVPTKKKRPRSTEEKSDKERGHGRDDIEQVKR